MASDETLSIFPGCGGVLPHPTPLYSAAGSALEELYEIRADDNK